MNDNRELFQNALCVGLVAACFTYLFWISMSDKAVNNQHIGDIKIMCVGVINAVVFFYIGSSRGSQKNAETIRKLVNPPDGTTTMTTKSPTPEGQESEIKQP